MPRHSGNRDAADRRNSPVHGGFSKAPATRSDFDSSCSLFAQADIDSVTNANARRLHPGARRAPADHAWHSGATRSRRSDVLWSRLRGPDQAFRLPEALVAVRTSRLSCKRAGKTRTLMPVWDSSGESRFRREQLQGASNHMKSKYVRLACMLVLAAGALAIRSIPLLATSAEYASLSAHNLYAVNQSSKNRGSISIYDIDAGQSCRRQPGKSQRCATCCRSRAPLLRSDELRSH